MFWIMSGFILYVSSTFVMGVMVLFLAGWGYGHRRSSLVTKEILEGEVVDLREAKRSLEEDKVALQGELSRMEGLNESLVERLKGSEEEKRERERLLLVQFENLSNSLLDAKSEKFTKQNMVQLEGLLAPLGVKIKEFQGQLLDSYRASVADRVGLKQEFERVHALYDRIHKESVQLSKAILGDNKVQGSWGEVHALQILEGAGLRKNEQYFVQQVFKKEDGKRLIPDIIIKLPGDRNIVMDVKVSLVDYLRFFNTDDKAERKVHLRKHIKSIRNHITSLGGKRYTQIHGLAGLDFVLLLLPVEPAFSLALQEEPSLFQEAYEKNIVLVSPATLRATLTIIEQLWRAEYRNKHALALAEESGALYDKFVSFWKDLQRVGQQLKGSQSAYDAAVKKLVGGRGNLVRRVERLREMGAKAHKRLDIAAIESMSDSLGMEGSSAE